MNIVEKIDKEIEFAKKINPQMAMGMIQIKTIIQDDIEQQQSCIRDLTDKMEENLKFWLGEYQKEAEVFRTNNQMDDYTYVTGKIQGIKIALSILDGVTLKHRVIDDVNKEIEKAKGAE